MATLMRNLIGSEPKLKNRFIFEFLNPGFDIPSWLVQTTSMPSIEVNDVEIPYFNTSQYISGRYKWNKMEVTFISPIGPSTTQKLMEALRLGVESFSGRMGYSISYKFNCTVSICDPVGTIVEKWGCYNCQINKVENDKMDYKDDGFISLTVGFQPDYCEQLF